jgi:hypothetical protein
MIFIEKGYTYQVRFSDEDKEYVGTCLQFPSLSWLDPDEKRVLEGIKRLVRNVTDDMRRNGEEIPNE